MKTLIQTLSEAIATALSLWKTYLEHKAEMYDLHLKKRRMKALNIAEDAFDVVREIFDWVAENIKDVDGNWKEYIKLKEKFYRYNRKFDDYD